jgi:hypothetical protein
VKVHFPPYATTLWSTEVGLRQTTLAPRVTVVLTGFQALPDTLTDLLPARPFAGVAE